MTLLHLRLVENEGQRYLTLFVGDKECYAGEDWRPAQDDLLTDDWEIYDPGV